MRKASLLFTTALIFTLLVAACGGGTNNTGNTTGQKGNATTAPTLDTTGNLNTTPTSGMGDTTATPLATTDTGAASDTTATPMATSDTGTAGDTTQTPMATATQSTGMTGSDVTGQTAQHTRLSDLMNYAVVDASGNQVGSVRGMVIAVTGSSDTTSSSNSTGGTSSSTTQSGTDKTTATPEATAASGSTSGSTDTSKTTATPEATAASGSTSGSTDSSKATATPASSNSSSSSTGSDSTSTASTGQSGAILYVVVDRTGFSGSSSGSNSSSSSGSTSDKTTATPEVTGTPDSTSGATGSGSTDSSTTSSAGNGSGYVLVPWTAFTASGYDSTSLDGSGQPLKTATPDSNSSSDNGTSSTDKTTATPDSSSTDQATATPDSGSTGMTGSGSAQGQMDNTLVLAVDASVLDSAPTFSQQELAQASTSLAMNTALTDFWASQVTPIPATGSGAVTGMDQNMVTVALQNDYQSIQVVGADSSSIGQLQDFIVNRGTGMVDYAVLSIQGKMTPVPMDHFTVQQSGMGGVQFMLDMDASQLSSAPTMSNYEKFDFSSGWDADYSSYWQSQGSGTTK